LARTGRSPNRRIVRAMCSRHGMSKDGAKPQKEYSPGQRAADMVTSKDGAKPQKEYSPGQRPGCGFIN
ncbi:hypothetical protein, partial [Hoylesella timonensis]